ncbi:extended synaptotagmin-2-like [Scleropages formosus]|uniref:Extended synaptotagmin 2 n=1 Tax=Scleropages formosus TaxID=113540 RepID=A0A8C9U3G3_SCLFO|nr:extended synaptotagmin-2-like [Scleropages formosus]
MERAQGAQRASPLDAPEEPRSTISDVGRTWARFARTFALIFPVYALGFLGFSFSWILIGAAALFWWRKNRREKTSRLDRALAYLELEETPVRQKLTTSELPSWVHFPDVERVEWLNKTVKQMWPYICQFVDKLFHETIEPAVKGANPHLNTFGFTKVDLGDKPLRINGVKVYNENVDKRQIIMDLEISFAGNTEIDVDIKRYYCRAGIKSIQLQGVVRVIMEPLLGDVPLVGALSIFFLKKPFLDINWTGLTNMLDIPGLDSLCDGLIQDIIYSCLVLPNRITIPLVEQKDLEQLRFPMPLGVLRIHFVEAQDLEGKDTYLGGLIKGKSDPYGVIQVGNQLFQSKTINDNLNPKWNEVYEVLVYDCKGQQLDIELYDEDPDKDDFLGSLSINMEELQKMQKVDGWFVLEEAVTGKLHLRLEWLSLLSSPEKLEEALISTRADQTKASPVLSSAVLLVYLDSAKNLPSGKKLTSDPSPYVQFILGQKKFDSKIRYKTMEPVWEESFMFLVPNPRNQELKVEVKDDKHKCSLGTITLPLTELLEAENMTLEQRFPLKNSGPSSTLKLKMGLRILSLEKTGSSDQPSSVQLKKASADIPASSTAGVSAGPSSNLSSSSTPRPQVSTITQGPASTILGPTSVSFSGPTHEMPRSGSGPAHLYSPSNPGSMTHLSSIGKSTSSLAIGGSHKESTPSIASDMSLPNATQELQQRLRQMQNGSASGPYSLGRVKLTLRHSAQRNKLIVVVHSCQNLIAFSKDGSDPYVRLYLLPNKKRSGRRKTGTVKKNQNPVFDQTLEFSVTNVELQRRVLDVAVKNGGGILSKHKGLLGKVLVDLSSEEIVKGHTEWYDLSEDGFQRSEQT